MEQKKIQSALSKCGYPKWAFKKVQENINKKKDKEEDNKKTKKKRGEEEKKKTMVVIPYIQGLLESVGRVLRKHGVSAAMRPYCTLRSILVHPKGERKETEKCEELYKIPCMNYDSRYIGETVGKR